MRNRCFINFVFAVILIKFRNTISKTTKTGHSGGTPNSSWVNFLEKLFVIDKPLTIANNVPNAVFLSETPYVWAAVLSAVFRKWLYMSLVVLVRA